MRIFKKIEKKKKKNHFWKNNFADFRTDFRIDFSGFSEQSIKTKRILARKFTEHQLKKLSEDTFTGKNNKVYELPAWKKVILSGK